MGTVLQKARAGELMEHHALVLVVLQALAICASAFVDMLLDRTLADGKHAQEPEAVHTAWHGDQGS